MTYLFVQIFLCLLLAFLIGLLIGWWMGRRRDSSRVTDLEAELASCRRALRDCEDAKAGDSGSAGGSPLAAAAMPAAAPVAAAAAFAVPSEPDDLKKIWGIGPKMEELLNGAGINTFAQLANSTVEQLQEIVAAYGSKRLTDIANEEVWPEQAAMAAQGNWDELKAYQEKLSWREGGGKPQD